MAELITKKVAVGISACVFDCPVRYNGKAFDALKLLGREKGDFVWTPVCPECMAGLGVPRMPIHLTGTGQDVLAGTAKVLDRRGHDVTEQIIEAARDALRIVERSGAPAFVAKEASPTCGLFKARVGKRRTEQAGGSGVFGALLLESGRFLIPDTGLSNPLQWWDWRRRLHAWLWLREREIAGSRDLYDAWHVLKFVVQETDRPAADAIGRELAALPKRASAEQLGALRRTILDALRTPSTKPRIKAALFKTYAHARKKGRLEGVDLHGLVVGSPEERETVDEIARQLITLERISFENDMLFGTSPVLERDRKRVKQKEEESDGRS